MIETDADQMLVKVQNRTISKAETRESQEELGLKIGASQRETSRLILGRRVVPPASLMDRVFTEAGTSLRAVLAERDGATVPLTKAAVAFAKVWQDLTPEGKKAVGKLARAYQRRGKSRAPGDG